MDANQVDPPNVNPEVVEVPPVVPPVAPPGQVEQQINPRFALTPYQATIGIIDYHTSEGRKFYAKATSTLSDEPFGCTSDDLLAFLEDLARRANEFGWNEAGIGIMEIPDQPGDPNTTFTSLLDNYGEFSLLTIRAHEESYIFNQSRAAQETVLMFHCLMNSLSREGKAQVILWKHEYMLGDIPSGNLLLKIIIRESCIDTNATTSTIRLRLSNLDKFLPSVGFDIAKFNQYVQQQVKALNSRGETTQDLLTNLFKGYLAAKDKSFCAYINSKKEDHEEGQTITTDQLMKWAKNKYEIIKEAGKWNAPSHEEQQIIALRAEIKTMKQGTTQQKPQTKNRRKFQGKPNRNWEDKPDWFNNPPSAKDKHKSRTWLNREWYWCGSSTGGQCEKWRQHKPETCGQYTPRNFRNSYRRHNNDKNAQDSKQDNVKKVKFEERANTSDTGNKRRKLQLQQALSAVVSDKDEDQDSA